MADQVAAPSTGVIDDIGRRFLDLINNERATNSAESTAIHEAWLRRVGVADSPKVASQLTWSQEAATVAGAHAARCAGWRMISHDDLEDGSDPHRRLSRAISGLAASGENLAMGTQGWFGPERAHAAFMAEAPGVPDNHRGIILNPVFDEVGVGWAVAGGNVVYVLNFIARAPAGAQAALPAPWTFIPRNARFGTAGTRRAHVPDDEVLVVDVTPDWEPRPVRWTFLADRKGGTLRSQMADWLGVEPALLHAVDLADGSASILDDHSVLTTRGDEGVVAQISLRPIDSDLLLEGTERPSSAGAPPRDTAPSAIVDASEATRLREALGPITEREARLSDLVESTGAAPSLLALPSDAGSYLPKRGPGVPEQLIHVMAATEITETTAAGVELALGQLAGLKEREDKTSSDPSFHYRVRSDAILMWDRGRADTVAEARSLLLRFAETKAREFVNTPTLYLRPYDGEGSRDAVLRELLKRAYWLKRTSDRSTPTTSVAEAFSDALATGLTRAISESLFDHSANGGGGEDGAVFSTTDCATFLAASDLTLEEGVWQGLANALEEVFVNLPDVQRGTEDARIALRECGVGLREEKPPTSFDPVDHFLGRLGSEIGVRLRAKLERELILDRTGGLKRKDETRFLTNVERVLDKPGEMLAGIADLEALERETLWIIASRLREAIESGYRIHVAGREGRNFRTFRDMLDRLAADLDADPLDESPRKETWTIDQVAARRSLFHSLRVARFEKVRNVYGGFLKRMARVLLPWTRSRLSRDAAAPLAEAIRDAAALHVLDCLERWVRSGRLARPVMLAGQAMAFADGIVSALVAAQQSREQAHEALFGGRLVIAEVDDGFEACRTRACNAARSFWEEWSRRAPGGWMDIGTTFFQTGGEGIANPFRPTSGIVFERARRAVATHATSLLVANWTRVSEDAIRRDIGRVADLLGQTRPNERTVETCHAQRGLQIQPTQTVTWIVVAGCPGGDPREKDDLRRQFESFQNIHFGQLSWIPALHRAGLWVTREIHGIPLKAIA